MITIDIETAAIEQFKPLLPKPVGIALRWETGESEYLSFGHPTGNNSTWAQAEELLQLIWHREMLTHNGTTFDIPVLQHWFELPPRAPLLTHDTLYLAFLNNPHATSLSLKDLANDLCHIPPTEQRELQDWILANTSCKSRARAGGFISEAPAELVGPYAIGDVERTYALWQHFQPVRESMREPYERELRLAPILVGMRNKGVRIDVPKLQADAVDAETELEVLDAKIRDVLQTPELNIDSDAEVIASLQAQGFTGFEKTATGKDSAAKTSLDGALESDPALRAVLSRRTELSTLLSTFIRPWLVQSASTGRVHPAYNAVRNPDGYGTRTGRLSSSEPNLQNVPPVMRQYVLPELGHDWVTGDFKSQEPRLAAHFEDGVLLEAFQNTPELDQYLWIAEIAKVTRKQAKTIFLGLLYSMGVIKLAGQLGIGEGEANLLREKIRATLPGIMSLNRQVIGRFKCGQHIKTLGGRIYHCEPSKDGRSFEYKALNVLIQGSAADQAKEALIYVQSKLEHGERIIGMVHDEISVSCRPGRTAAIKQVLQQAALALPCDAPMLMDCGEGSNWGEAK